MTQTEMPASLPQWAADARLGLDALSGPAPAPIVGWRGNIVRFAVDPIAYLDELAHGGYGDVAMFARGMRGGVLRPGAASPGAVLALGPAHNQQVLTRNTVFEPLLLEPPRGARGFERLYSGLLWMHGEKHRQQRRLISPAFHQRRLDGYRDVLVALTEQVLDRWRPGRSVSLHDEARKILIGFLNRVLVGIDDASGAVSLGERMEDLTRRTMSPVAMIPLDLPFTPRRQLIEHANRLSDDLDAIIARKRAWSRDADDMLSTLIQARDEDGTAMSEDELVGQLYLLFFAGFESSMSVLVWTCYLLAQHPKVAADLHDELSAALRGGAPTMDQLRELPMLDAVIKESLRLFPPVYIITRSPCEPVELGRAVLPAKTEVFLSVYHTHRLRDLYAEPRRFLPERWRSIDPGSFGYMPFGGGAHTCIGWGLALLELKIMLAIMVQRFRIEMPRGARIDGRALAVLSPKQGVRMRVRAQDRRFERSRAEVRGNFTRMVDLGR